MGAVMRRRRAAGLPWRRGDQWGATSATLAGQERAACAFERTARCRTLRSNVGRRPKNYSSLSLSENRWRNLSNLGRITN